MVLHNAAELAKILQPCGISDDLTVENVAESNVYGDFARCTFGFALVLPLGTAWTVSGWLRLHLSCGKPSD